MSPSLQIQGTPWLSANLDSYQDSAIRYDMLLNCARHGVLGLDNFDRIIYMNFKAQSILGFDYNLNAGVSIYESLRGRSIEKHIAPLLKRSKEDENEPAFITTAGILRESKLRHFQVKKETTSNSGLPEDCRFFSFMDRTDHYCEVKSKSALNNIVANELKTPITAFSGYITWLENYRSGDAELQDTVADLKEICQRLGQGAANILNVTELESDYKVNVQQVNIKSIINEEIIRLRFTLKKKRIKLSVCNHLESPYIWADPRLIQLTIMGKLSHIMDLALNGLQIEISITSESSAREGNLNIHITFLNDEINNTSALICCNNLEKGYSPLPGSSTNSNGYLCARSMELLEAKTRLETEEKQTKVLIITIPVEFGNKD